MGYNMSGTITKQFEKASDLLKNCISHSTVLDIISLEIIRCFERGNKLLIFGNGGSSSQAQHFAAEFVNRFLFNRKALPAISLSTDTSIITSIGNDFDFTDIFSRQIEALGFKGDVAWGLSTSGKSENVIKAFKKSKEMGLLTLSFTGQGETPLTFLSDMVFSVPSNDTPRIQEAHLCAGHAVCQIVEEHFRVSSK